MKTDKKLFLLDAFALIYRAYFAFSNNHRVNSKGLNTSAIFGFTNTLLDVLKKEKPSHIAVVFDTAEPTVRHEAFEDYKAQREDIPEDIVLAIPFIQRIIEGFNIPVLSLDGYEADDVIGTLAKKAEKEGFITYMMTPDKDYGQLVSENIFIYRPARGGGQAEVLGPKEVCEKWQIKNVDQLIDILGLMGDSVDNIPGIPGVGEKTAIQLIRDYGSIDNLYKDTSGLKGKLKEKVENNKDLALQSRMLATIICDVPIEFDETSLRLDPPDKEKLMEVFQELEFRTLAAKVFSQDNGNSEVDRDLFGNPLAQSLTENSPPESEMVPTLKTLADVTTDYKIANTESDISGLLLILNAADTFCFDSETTGLDPLKDEIIGISFSVKMGEAWYVPVPEGKEQARSFLQQFEPVFSDPNKTMVGQNIKFDMAMVLSYGIEIKNKLFDTMVAHYLIRPDMRHSMDLLAETYLNYSPVSITSLIGKKGKDQLSMKDVPLKDIAVYAAEDADVTLQLYHVFKPMLAECGAEKIFYEIESPLIPVLCRMEFEGIKLDTGVLGELSKILEAEAAEREKEVFELSGMKFNISSPKQVGDVLFGALRIVENPKKTKTGQFATGEDVLDKLRGKHPIVDKILEFRELQKLKNTYVDALPQLVDPGTGRLHTTFNQVVAVTGRLSSDNPNLQNIPIRTEKGREIRKAFVPGSEDFVLLSADYSQIELRIMAHMSKDQGMMEAFKEGLDIHTATAAKVFHVELDKVDAEMRRKAKMVNFGIIYGISAFGLAERLSIPRAEAKEIIDNYFTQYPGIRNYMDQGIENAKAKGYVETILGRRRYLPDIHSSNQTVRGFAERNAINAPIQGSAADMIKIAMVSIDAALRTQKLKTKMLLQVHDELVFDVHKKELDTIKPLVKELMEKALPLDIPVLAEVGTGPNWLEAH
jgi:DNA polymerase I